MRESFIFYHSWLEAIDEASEIEQAHIYSAIAHYALNLQEPTGLKGLEKIVFLLAKPQIDANHRRYLNGLKGGPKNNLNATKKKPKRNLKTTEKQPNVNDNVNDNVNNNVNDNVNNNDRDKENEVSSSLSLSREDADFLFKLYKEYPEFINFNERLSFGQWKELCSYYGTKHVQNKMREIANFKGVTNKYDSLYLTLKSWLERDVKN